MTSAIYLREPCCTNQHLQGTQQQEQLIILMLSWNNQTLFKNALGDQGHLAGFRVCGRSQMHSGEEKSGKIKVSVQCKYHAIFNNWNRKPLALHRILCVVTMMVSNRSANTNLLLRYTTVLQISSWWMTDWKRRKKLTDERRKMREEKPPLA